MEPIALEKIPDSRFSKTCYICDEENRCKPTSNGACMDCAKTGCKFSFHVTCAQMSGLLCEEAGSSNTTKYCGYCSQHFSKTKKANPFKKLSCSKVYRVPNISSDDASSTDELHVGTSPNNQHQVTSTSQEYSSSSILKINENENPVHTATLNDQTTEQIDSKPPTLSSSFTLSSLAEAAVTAIKQEPNTDPAFYNAPQEPQPSRPAKEKITKDPDKKIKRKPAKKRSGADISLGKLSKEKKLKPITKVALQKAPSRKKSEKNILRDVGFAAAPKHSVINLSTFGEESLEPSEPGDIGKRKPTLPPEQATDADGLTAIQNLAELQKSDMLQFFQEFGAPASVSPVLKMLQEVRDENQQLEKNLEQLQQVWNLLVALKSKLSVPLSYAKQSNRPEEAQEPVQQSMQTVPPTTIEYQYYANK
uniref:PHD-type domain-containing protein n=1 Tax=Ciona savignyi TaxID=51511 RepID=H2Y4F1_CIOSA